jgi:hypothetical protein
MQGGAQGTARPTIAWVRVLVLAGYTEQPQPVLP